MTSRMSESGGCDPAIDQGEIIDIIGPSEPANSSVRRRIPSMRDFLRKA